MDEADIFRRGLTGAIALLGRAIAAARTEEETLIRQFAARKRRAASMRNSAQAKRLAARDAARLPVIGRFLAARKNAEADRETAAIESVERELERIRQQGREVRKDRLTMEASRQVIEFVLLRARPDMSVPLPRHARSMAMHLLNIRNGSPSRSLVANLTRSMAQAGSMWIKAQKDLDRKRTLAIQAVSAPFPDPVQVKPARKGILTPDDSRIYFPIPISNRHAALRAGALYDPQAPRGSRVYIPKDADRAPFDRFLPMAYRKRRPVLSFPPIRPNARRHAIWGIFDRDTWDHIRAAAYDRVGNRCILCGRQSGPLKERIFPNSRTGPVECHEVWDWEVPEPGIAIGIQRLRHLLVVCFECHMMFHESYFVEKAREAGLGNEVQERIEQRRLEVTGLDREQLVESLRRSEAEYREQERISQWVMDLSHLAAQDFMSYAQPVLLETNRAGVPPELIGGLSFTTDVGRHFEARDAAEIYERLADHLWRFGGALSRWRRD